MILRIIFTVLLLVAVSNSVKEYRSDYEYNRETDAFYKLHTDGLAYLSAKYTCEDESAKLMTALPNDVVQAHGMLKRFPDIGNFIWSGNDGSRHESVLLDPNNDILQAQSVINYNANCEVISREGEVFKLECDDERPFICKVEAKHAPYDPQCNVFSTGYQYLENVGSCYKVSSTAFTWNQAFDDCQAERAHLLVLNSDLEHQAVHNLTHFAPRTINKAYSRGYWFAGIRAKKSNSSSPVVFKTIFDQTLREAGFDKWSEGEPNNSDGNELCGAIFTNDGKYNDVKCYHPYAFICETEINKKI